MNAEQSNKNHIRASVCVPTRDRPRTGARMSSSFANDLRRYGPGSGRPAPDLTVARGFCDRLIRSRSDRATTVAALLPRRVAPHVRAVEAWYCWAEGLSTGAGGGPRALELLAWWRDELRACYDRRPTHPVTVVLGETLERYDLPQRAFLDVLFALEQDQLVTRYATSDQLLDYCRHSANPLGQLALVLGRVRDDAASALADHVCTGLRLAKVCRDVAPDFDRGRIYVPEEDRKAFGCSEDWTARRATPVFRELMRSQVERARDELYRGYPLVDHVPAALRVVVELTIEIGLADLRRLERHGFDAWTAPRAMSWWERARLTMWAIGRQALAGRS